ncbi:hypothetical protein BDW22DRAFT_702977 [Trametopsis cervina]|nr:hypothetical protein BDW22DRAFT_702977 [Trametopsis cervina]
MTLGGLCLGLFGLFWPVFAKNSCRASNKIRKNLEKSPEILEGLVTPCHMITSLSHGHVISQIAFFCKQMHKMLSTEFNKMRKNALKWEHIIYYIWAYV